MSEPLRGPVFLNPLVSAYLDDLARALSGVEESERGDVVASVGEHIEAALGDGEPTAADVRTVLEHLGPVERIAAAAEPGLTVTVVRDPAGGRPEAAPGWSAWAGPVLIALAGLSLALVPVNPFVAVPLAVVVGAVAVAGMRRHRGVTGLFVAAGAVSALTLVLSIALALTLLSAGAGEPTPGDLVEVTPPDGG
ncbi:hypothetical protein [Cellulomonas sp. KRMCY2]|uniref:HAAS signaling domain-containing protein n=1 Tax=Cellulomonas sp. KRMCY2 TaxID=1304865 RepID=UPI00045E5D89|nr:hypothetical protein [Cellulomonas sp. KRMCY2]